MNSLMKINEVLKMSSREISALTGSRHGDVCRSIERLMESKVIGGYAPSAYTHPQNGQTYQEYFLDKRDSLIVVAQLFPAFTAAIVDRWQELEDKHNPKIGMQESAMMVMGIAQAISAIPGVKVGIAYAHALTCVSKHTGVNLDDMRLALPAADEPICSANATKLGELMGLSARSTNIWLEANGFQTKNARGEWELTEEGKKWGEALPYANGKHSGYQILWNPKLASL
jgi:hypothetical protein